MVDEHKRTRLLESATRLVFLHGPQKLTVDEVSINAGLGKGTFYLYFKSKEDVLRAVAQFILDDLLNRFKQALSDVSLHPTEKIRKIIEIKLKYYQGILKDEKYSQMAMIEISRHPIIRPIFEQYFSHEYAMIRNILREGNKKGCFAVSNVEIITTAITSSLDMEPYLRLKNREDASIVNEYTNLFFKGVLASTR